MSKPIAVLFVCLGNICRSPTAHGVFQKMVKEANLVDQIQVDSSGTGDWHIGRQPDARAQQHALRRGYDLSALRARLVSKQDFEDFDYILAMDNQNMLALQSLSPANYAGQLCLLLDFLHREQGMEVPDPYYGGEAGFELVLDMVEEACANLLVEIRKKHHL